MSPLTRFEKFARELVEGSVDRLLGEQYIMAEAAGALAAAVERSRQDDMLANRYEISLHPDTLSQLMSQTPGAAEFLEELLVRLAAEGKMVLAGDAQIELGADEKVAKGMARVTAHLSAPQDEPTAVLIRKKSPTAPLERIDAFLIVNGRRHVTLGRAVTSIGRALDNHVVLEEPGVSRKHAQIRWRSGRFVIFDLGSRAGTIVNDRAVHEQGLNPGDVIRLGSAAIIFGQESIDAKPGRISNSASDDITRELFRDELP
ncbi:MAG: DUF3662 domain-containing protein [Chloroflexota bacterium]|nr:MAG: DUF3662 domain-containing protein [Chloroflexota bacterium]